MNYIKFTRESFSTFEDWKTLCEEVGANPFRTYAIFIDFDKVEAEINEYA